MAIIETNAIIHPKLMAPALYWYVPYEMGSYLYQLSAQIVSMNRGVTPYQQILKKMLGCSPFMDRMLRASRLAPYTHTMAAISKKAM